MDEGFERALKITSQKHDVIAVPIVDASERELQSCRDQTGQGTEDLDAES
jgi:hypothetical protein